jgi:TonB family protein
VLTEGKLPTFSFFRLLFWDNSQTFTELQKLQVVGHELAHIRQWHSLDIIFLELIKSIFWFHPAAYLFKKDLQQTHEYLADAAVVQQHSPDSYIQLIIAQVFQSSGLTLINPFSQFKTKNRIIMLKKKNRAKPAFWKMALSLPLIAMLVLIYSCDTTHPEELLNSTYSSQIKEVVEEMPAPVNDLQLDLAQRIKYPEEARKNEVEGNVVLQFVVKKDGNVDDVIVLKGLGSGCDEEAVKAVRSIKWHPGKEEGKPVDVRMTIPVAFALSDAKRAALLKNLNEKVQSLNEHGTEFYELQTPYPENQEIHRVVEVQPKPKDGIPALMRYFGENIRYPEEARKKGIEGKVFLQFVVQKDGSINNIQVLKGLGNGCDEEAVRVLKSMPAWQPGSQKGKHVNVMMSLPINFKLD